jgi:hypothetical protein
MFFFRSHLFTTSDRTPLGQSSATLITSITIIRATTLNNT